MSRSTAIGIDVGGSHISCAGFNFEKIEYVNSSFSISNIDTGTSAEEIIKAWSKTIQNSMAIIGEENLMGIGFAMPGPFDYLNGIPLFTGQNEKFKNFKNISIPDLLRKELALPKDFKIRFINDATAFAIGEDWVGSAQDSEKSLCITLGTGFGSAFISDSLPAVNDETVPTNGCVWNLPWKEGIADDYFSTRGIISNYLAASGIKVKGAKEVARACRTDNKARQVYEDFGSGIIQCLSEWLAKFSPDTMVIGGNIANAIDLFLPAMQEEMKRNGHQFNIRVSKLKEVAAIVGSARLIDDDYYQKVRPLLAYM